MLLAVGRGAARRAAVVCGAGRRLSSATASFIYDVTSADFGAKVLQAPVPVILDCHADWCGPCKQLGPVLKEHVAALQGTVALAMLDVDAEQELSGQLNIKSLPTVFGVWKGGVQDHFVGAKSDAEVAAFVRTMAALGGGGGAAEGDSSRKRSDGLPALKDQEHIEFMARLRRTINKLDLSEKTADVVDAAADEPAPKGAPAGGAGDEKPPKP